MNVVDDQYGTTGAMCLRLALGVMWIAHVFIGDGRFAVRSNRALIPG